jgi:hypothetical protein
MPIVLEKERKQGEKASDHLFCSSARDGKVRFGPVLQGILKNPELDYRFGPLITVNLGPDHWFGPKRSGSGSQVV